MRVASAADGATPLFGGHVFQFTRYELSAVLWYYSGDCTTNIEGCISAPVTLLICPPPI